MINYGYKSHKQGSFHPGKNPIYSIFSAMDTLFITGSQTTHPTATWGPQTTRARSCGGKTKRFSGCEHNLVGVREYIMYNTCRKGWWVMIITGILKCNYCTTISKTAGTNMYITCMFQQWLSEGFNWKITRQKRWTPLPGVRCFYREPSRDYNMMYIWSLPKLSKSGEWSLISSFPS